jgi:hypothetical protein
MEIDESFTPMDAFRSTWPEEDHTGRQGLLSDGRIAPVQEVEIPADELAVHFKVGHRRVN